MNEKKYLKWYNKVGYGSGDIAGNVVYAFLTSFVMIYLTDTIGLNAGIVGTLIAVSKIFDGVTDLFFGSMIDKTKSKMGKARPWMFYGFFGCAVTLVGIFAIPTSLGKTAQYAWFFICYTLLNAVFYTANNIAYSALTSLVTKNNRERVEMGSFRFIFAFSTSLLIQAATIGLVTYFGNDAAAWRTVAIPPLPWTEETKEEIINSFHDTHEHFYTFRLPDTPTEIVNLHLVAYGCLAKPELAPIEPQEGPVENALKETRKVYFTDDGWMDTPIYDREALGSGVTLEGPVIVEEAAASTVVAKGQQLTVDTYGNLIIETEVQE